MTDMKTAAALELRAMQSAWRALRAEWQLSDPEVRELLPEGGEYAPAPPLDTETRMRLLIQIGYRIPRSIEDLDEWLRCPSVPFAFLSPLEAMSGGLSDLRKVRRIVEQERLL